MKILNSANLASLVNIMLKNARGTTTTTDGASAAGLIVAEDLSNIVDAGAELSNLLTVANFRNVITGMLEGVGKFFTKMPNFQRRHVLTSILMKMNI